MTEVGLKISLCILSNILIAHFGDENVPTDWESIGTFEDVDVHWVRQTTDEPRATRLEPGSGSGPLLPLHISVEDRDRTTTPSRFATHEPLDMDADFCDLVRGEGFSNMGSPRTQAEKNIAGTRSG